MKEKQWDEESLQYWTWHVGDYWKILNIKDTSQVIGYCLVCPVDYEHPGVEETHHRHWYLFSDTPPVHWTLFNGDLTETPWLGHNRVRVQNRYRWPDTD